MLANSPTATAASGSLSKDVHLSGASYYNMLDFIADELPRWRDEPGRPAESSERQLTDQLCNYLNSVARMSQGWDYLQFRTEVPDEVKKGRSVDLTVKPCAATVWIEGKGYSHHEMLLPIECKRLPTPKAADRDEREYVYSQYGTTGGIQRFKLGVHGAAHRIAAMIAYIQGGETSAVWSGRIGEWICDLAKGDATWTADDCLVATGTDVERQTCRLRSQHRRSTGLPDIELRHLWIAMN